MQLYSIGIRRRNSGVDAFVNVLFYSRLLLRFASVLLAAIVFAAIWWYVSVL